MIGTLFIILVVVGFFLKLMSAAGAWPRAELAAWAVFFAAAIVWAITQYHGT